MDDIVLLSIIGFLLSLILPIVINFSFYVNVLKNIGVVVIRFWGVPLISFKVTLSQQVITIIKKKGKQKQVKLDLFDPHILFIRYFVKSVFAVTIIDYCKLFADVGVKNNAFLSSMMSGALCAMVESGFSILHNKKTYTETFVDIVPSSNENEGKICGEIKIVSIPILLLYGFVRAKILTKRWFKLYERYSRI